MGSLGRIPNVVIWLSSLWETLMMLQRKTNFSGLTDGTFYLSTCFQIYVHSYRSVHARMHVWLHQILAAHFANVLQMHISYKYLFHTPKPFCTIFPLGTSPSFLPLDWELPHNLNKTTTDAERHNQAAAAELSLPPLANTMQMSCAEHDPGCPEASTPVRCLVCQQENDCRENDSSLTLALRCSPLHMRYRRTGNRGDHEVGEGAERVRRKARKEESMKRTEWLCIL